MRLIYNSDAQRLQKNFDDKTPVTVSELFRSERTASVPIELFLVDNDEGYATPGSSDYEVLIGRQAQAVTTGKLTLTFTGTTEEIDLSKPKLATRIEAALNAVSEVDAAGGVDVVELNNGRAFQITFRLVGSRAAITAGVNDSMQPASVLISEVTAGTGSTREVQLLTLEEASLAEVSTVGWSANSNPALTITTLVEGTANTREVVQLSVTGDPAPGSFFVVSNSEPISTEATAAQVKTILNSALSNDIGSVKKTGERIWQITYKTNGDKTALSAGTHNLVKRPSVNATLSLNTTALAYAANSDGSDLSVGFTLKKGNEVLLSENVDLAEPFAEVIGSSAMLNNDSLGALFTIAGNDVNKGTAISLSGGLTYSSDTLAAPFLPLAGGTMTGDALFGDNVKATFGNADDLQIYHDGSASFIDVEAGTGEFYIRANNLRLANEDGSGQFINANNGGNVEFFYNNSKKFETTDTGATISGKLIVNGDLDVSGTTTTFNSTVVTVDDPVFTVGGDTAPDASDNKDRGIEFRYFRSGESAKIGFFGYDNSSDAFTFLTDATNNSEVFSGTLGTFNIGKVQVSSGSASFPSFRFGDDLDTGIFKAAGNTLAFTTGGTEAARFDSSGRLGIGCTPSARLEITTASQGDTALQVGFTNSTPNLIVGTTTGSTKLEIANGDYDHKFYSRNGSGTAVERLAIEGGSDIADIKIINSNLGIGGTPSKKLHIKNGASGFSSSYNVRTQAIIESDTASGTALAIMAKNTGSSAIWFGDQDGETVGQVGYNHTNNTLNFATEGATQAILNSTGLGINCTAATALHIKGTTTFDGDGNSRAVITSSTESGIVSLDVGGFNGTPSLARQIKFFTNQASGAKTEAARFNSSGCFGINQPSPSSTYKLDVGGSVRLATSAPSLVFRETDASNQEFSLFGLGGDFYIRDITNSSYPFKVQSGASNDTLVISLDSRVGIGGSPSGTTTIHSALDCSSDFDTHNKYALNLHNSADDTNESLGISFGLSSNLTAVGAAIAHERKGTGSFGDLYFLTKSSSAGVTEKMRIDSNGNVGIGTTSPSHKLTLSDATSPGIKIIDTTNDVTLLAYSQNSDAHIGTYSNHPLIFDANSSEAMRIDSSGNVGIGTNSPTAKIDLSTGSYPVDKNYIRFGASNEAGNESGGLIWKTKYLDYTKTSASIEAIGENNFFRNALIFKTENTADKTTDAIERMRIAANGNVGIGTTSPSSLLHLKSISADTKLLVETTSGNDAILELKAPEASGAQSHIRFSDDTANVGGISYNHNSSGSDYMQFYTASTERMRIDSSGNVGIGCTPSNKLTVEDTIGIKRASVPAITTLQQTGNGLEINAPSGYHNLIVKNNSVPHFQILNTNSILQNYINYTNGSNYEALKISAESDHIKYDTTSIGSFASNTREHRFSVNNSLKFRVSSSGVLNYGHYYIVGNYELNNSFNDLILSTSSQTDNDIVFKPNNTEAFRISGLGKVGINHNDPNRDLNVVGQIGIDNSQASPSGGMLIAPDGSSNKIYSRTGNAVASAHPLDFFAGSTHTVRIEADGDVEIQEHGKGLILSSPDGTRYKITVANDGTVTSTAV